MKHLKQNGYNHNPKALLDTFKRNKPRRVARYCSFCGEPDCQASCEPVPFSEIAKELIVWLLVVALVLFGLNLAMNWRFPEPTKPVATGVRA